MGASTFAVGLLPTYATLGWAAPILMVSLRLLQGLALGGEYGGAATYVAEHAPNNRRGYDTSWIQTTATLGLFLALFVIWACRSNMDPKEFADWGWRVPFWMSAILLAFSVYIRLKLEESPVFQKMKAEGKGSKSPLTDSFLKYPEQQVRPVGAAGRDCRAGRGLVHGAVLRPVLPDHHAQARLRQRLHPDRGVAADRHAVLHRVRLAVGQDRPAQDHPGGLRYSGDHLLPAVRRADALHQPGLEEFSAKTPISVTADPATCKFHIFVGPWSTFSDCDRTKDFLTKQGLSFKSIDSAAGSPVVTTIGGGADAAKITGPDQKVLAEALKKAGHSATPDKSRINWVMAEAILVIMVIYVTMVYGPIAAFLVELFPVRIRYTSMSLPYHIGNGWFGGMLPLTATAMVAATGDIYYGLWYPIVVALMTLVIGTLFLKEVKDRDISHNADTI